MKRNEKKRTLDLVYLSILIILCIIARFTPYRVVLIVALALVIILSIVAYIINRKIWRCPKCGRHLPEFHTANTDVICCPYCKTDID